MQSDAAFSTWLFCRPRQPPPDLIDPRPAPRSRLARRGHVRWHAWWRSRTNSQQHITRIADGQSSAVVARRSLLAFAGSDRQRRDETVTNDSRCPDRPQTTRLLVFVCPALGPWDTHIQEPGEGCLSLDVAPVPDISRRRALPTACMRRITASTVRVSTNRAGHHLSMLL